MSRLAVPPRWRLFSTRYLTRILVRLFAVFFGVLFALIIAEVGIRWLYRALPMGLQVALRDVRVTPFTDQRLAPPPLWQSDKDYLTVVRPGAEDSLQAGSPTVLFRVSSYAWWGGRVGFRSPPPTDGQVPLVALGDSHTFCFVEVADCWVTLLATALGQPIANLGQPVTGSLGHERIFNDFVANPALGLKQPRLVLWQFYGNDFNDDYGLAALNGTATAEPAPAAPSIPPATGFRAWMLENLASYSLLDALTRPPASGVEMFLDPYRVINGKVDIQFGQRYIRDSFDLSLPRNLEGEQLSLHAILRTRAEVERNGGAFVVVIVPTKEEAYSKLTESRLSVAGLASIAAPRERMLAFCAEQKLVCLDLLPALRTAAESGAGQQLYFPTDPHLNVDGNTLVASTVAAFLQDQQLVRSP